jgi:acyl-CoA thioester hydrolase
MIVQGGIMTGNYNLERPLQVELDIPIRTYDIDFAGIVSNVVYIRWLEDLRLKLLDEYLPLDKLIQQGCVPILTGTQIEYKRQIKLFDKLIGRMWIKDLGKIKVSLEAEFISNNQLAASAVQKGAFINLKDNRPQPVPEELQSQYSC